MKYPRPNYKDPTVKTAHLLPMSSSIGYDMPIFDYPIPAVENFRRCIALDNPLWCPVPASDVHIIGVQDVVTKNVRGMQIHSDYRNRAKRAPGDFAFKDWFNTDWTWVQSAGGAMLTPGTQLLADIGDWKTGLVFPDLSEWDFEETAERFMKEEYDPDKAVSINLGRGCTERLVSILGGYTEGLSVMLTEPEEVKSLFDRYSDFMIEVFDKLNSLYPIDIVTYHDDWGTERDTFFSERMMEELVFEPTKKIIDHIRSRNAFFMLHSCGNITRFMPYILDMKVDMLQIQRRAVDIPELKRKYGDRIGFNTGLEGFAIGKGVTKEELTGLVRNTVDIYSPKGGFYPVLFMQDPEDIWNANVELYAYSREFYDNEQGRP